MAPTDIYYKTKRTLLLFVGALLLAIFAGFKITTGEQKISFLPFQLARPELLTTILFVAVVFYLFQFSLQWASQQSEIQNNKFHRIDFRSTAAIGGISIICYIGYLALPYVKFEATVSLGSILISMVGALLSIYASGLLEKISTNLGRWLKRKTASEDDAIMNLLKSKNWILNYNPTIKGKEKQIEFKDNDQIGLGQNNNESKWKVHDGLLEILNHEGRVFSRFSYDKGQQMFVHTNDPDTLSIKSQTIRPRS